MARLVRWCAVFNRVIFIAMWLCYQRVIISNYSEVLMEPHRRASTNCQSLQNASPVVTIWPPQKSLSMLDFPNIPCSQGLFVPNCTLMVCFLKMSISNNVLSLSPLHFLNTLWFVCDIVHVCINLIESHSCSKDLSKCCVENQISTASITH